jgi:predicted nucleotidyltransferase
MRAVASTPEKGEQWVDQARQIAGDDLEAVVLFGSEARGQSRPSSDIDLLIVVKRRLDLSRDLYRRWDDQATDRRMSPHFVHLPHDVSTAGSLWFEVALDGVILYQETLRISEFLHSVRKAIADGFIRRRYTHGHPYWVKSPEVTHV